MTFWSECLNGVALTPSKCAAGGSSGYNGGPGSVGGTTYGAHGYDPFGQSQHGQRAQHAYGSSAMQPQAPSSPYGRSAGGAYGGGGGFGSAMGAPPANPYATAAAPAPARSSVRHMSCKCGKICCHSCVAKTKNRTFYTLQNTKHALVCCCYTLNQLETVQHKTCIAPQR